MASFELNIQEPGQRPRLVTLTQSLVVGRSRRADVTVTDQEVGREQFRIGVDRGVVIVEGIGKTNRTMVDGTVLEPGARLTLSPGATILVGKTTFVLQSGESTAMAARPAAPAEAPEATVIARGPIKPPPAGPATPSPARAAEEAPPPQEQTGGAVGPIQTMKMPRPGGNRPGAAAPAPVPPGPAGPAPPAASAGEIEQTMQWKGGFRPGAAGPAPRPQPTPTAPASGPPGPARPAPARPAPAPAPAPAPLPPPPAAPAPVPAKPARSLDSPRPTTVALTPTDIVPAGFADGAVVNALELESRLHEAMPRMFVKSDTMKRRIRLLKTRCTMGRGENSDVLLPVESVSETHAEITFDGARFVLRDCGSTNGTFVDGNHLRSTQHALVRHSLIGVGTLRAIFLCNTRNGAASDRRCEERALRLLVSAGRLTRDEAQQILRMASTDSSQSIAEILLMETALAATDWVAAVAGARNQVTFGDRVRGFFARFRPGRKTT